MVWDKLEVKEKLVLYHREFEKHCLKPIFQICLTTGALIQPKELEFLAHYILEDAIEKKWTLHNSIFL